ncbi:hypothetical protein H7J86_26180 [Mycobacterium hackensackense]|uniref:hypothetical protein n=1 Tax=Mycobacterium hackensackense TaxID=228909 RepID=UPI002265D611|nr:hypothetical protein [Mycobacterium hackensackense]MCV7255657.1 hypothetical protein [Mycobacterium hackensackense]
MSYVYRVVVDKWPTPDGQPFTAQTLEFWEEIVSQWNDGVPDPAIPAWLPNLRLYVPTRPDAMVEAPEYTRWIGYNGDPQTGDPGYTVIFVPAAPTRRFFSPNGVSAMCRQLREWSCEAHVERARVGEWEKP